MASALLPAWHLLTSWKGGGLLLLPSQVSTGLTFVLNSGLFLHSTPAAHLLLENHLSPAHRLLPATLQVWKQEGCLSHMLPAACLPSTGAVLLDFLPLLSPCCIRRLPSAGLHLGGEKEQSSLVLFPGWTVSRTPSMAVRTPRAAFLAARFCMRVQATNQQQRHAERWRDTWRRITRVPLLSRHRSSGETLPSGPSASEGGTLRSAWRASSRAFSISLPPRCFVQNGRTRACCADSLPYRPVPVTAIPACCRLAACSPLCLRLRGACC